MTKQLVTAMAGDPNFGTSKQGKKRLGRFVPRIWFTRFLVSVDNTWEISEYDSQCSISACQVKNVYEIQAYAWGENNGTQMFYENDADWVIGIAIIFTNANLSGVLLAAPSVWQQIYSWCFECAFCCLGSEWGEWPVNSSLLTLNHLFRWTLSSIAEREEERDGETEEVTEKKRREGTKQRVC